ncbi:unnamed protein product, partial [Heterotrigona itama]
LTEPRYATNDFNFASTVLTEFTQVENKDNESPRALEGQED